MDRRGKAKRASAGRAEKRFLERGAKTELARRIAKKDRKWMQRMSKCPNDSRTNLTCRNFT